MTRQKYFSDIIFLWWCPTLHHTKKPTTFESSAYGLNVKRHKKCRLKFPVLAKLFSTSFAHVMGMGLWTTLLNCDLIVHNVVHNAKLWPFVVYNWFKRSQFCIMNDIMKDKMGHNIVNDKQLCSNCHSKTLWKGKSWALDPRMNSLVKFGKDTSFHVWVFDRKKFAFGMSIF